MNHRNKGLAGGSKSYRQTQCNQGRISIDDLTPDSARALYLTAEQNTALLDLIDQSVSDRLNDESETQELSISMLSSVYGALSLIAEGQRTTIDELLSNLIKSTLSAYTVNNR